MSSNLLSRKKYRLSNFFYHNWLLRYYHTIKYLKWEQFFYRAYYPLKNKFFASELKLIDYEKEDLKARCFSFSRYGNVGNIIDAQNKTITLLNITKSYSEVIDWEDDRQGLLWKFHLHYFDWLNDNSLSVDFRLDTMLQYADNKEDSFVFKHSYPASIRIPNWIKFLSEQHIENDKIDTLLYQQAHRLHHFPEYEIQGNHLLQNGIALLWAALYFSNEKWERTAIRILAKELNVQILNDGAHFEQSYSYQSQILRSILDIIYFCKQIGYVNSIVNLLIINSSKLLSNLNYVTNNAGFYPNFGDANDNSSINFSELAIAARKLGILFIDIKLKESWIRKLAKERFSVYVNTGNIAATFQPGHAHADAFSYCLDFNNVPIIVDRGVSVYEVGAQRRLERSTAAHNTIVIDGKNSADVWSSFRLGKRAKVNLLLDGSNLLKMSIKQNNIECKFLHTRSFSFQENDLIVTDTFNKINGHEVKSYIHFSPFLTITQIENDLWEIKNKNTLLLKLKTSTNAFLETYQYCQGFNNTKTAFRLVMTITKINSEYKIIAI